MQPGFIILIFFNYCCFITLSTTANKIIAVNSAMIANSSTIIATSIVTSLTTNFSKLINYYSSCIVTVRADDGFAEENPDY